MVRKIRLLGWSLRKLLLPIRRNDLVLEIGSGGNPHPASHVLAEKFIDSSHRLKAIKIDRVTVLADACQLPFRDKAFDYAIAFHVLEHVPDPQAFAAEVSRVAKAGYVETPNMLYERMLPFDVHLLEVAQTEEGLVIAKKPVAVHDALLNAASPLRHRKDWMDLFSSRPELFHVCYRWVGQIKLKVLNPKTSTDWHNFPSAGLSGANGDDAGVESQRGSRVRDLIIALCRKFWLSWSSRKVDLDAILACPSCHGNLSKPSDVYVCASCSNTYRAVPIADFTQPLTSGM